MLGYIMYYRLSLPIHLVNLRFPPDSLKQRAFPPHRHRRPLVAQYPDKIPLQLLISPATKLYSTTLLLLLCYLVATFW